MIQPETTVEYVSGLQTFLLNIKKSVKANKFGLYTFFFGRC